MYTHNTNQLIMPDEFFLPFGGTLNPDNRWVVIASIIPWAEVESEYMKRLGKHNEGKKAYPVRLALGSLLIKEKMGLSDEETVLAITENPYLQYFIGLQEFQQKEPFDASSMTHFRKRFDADFINDMNELIVRKQLEKSSNNSKNDPPNKGGGTSSLD
ncbi:MAG TPA: transposase, partial [Virgibacillus sp.]